MAMGFVIYKPDIFFVSFLGWKSLVCQSACFKTGYEPTGCKIINNYFNLCWIEVVKATLSDAQQQLLRNHSLDS